MNSDVLELWDNAVSKNTLATYRTGLDHLKTFLTLHGVVSAPGQLPAVNEDKFILFATHLHKHLKLRYSTIKLYFAGIRFFYLKGGYNNPLHRLERLEYILRGIKRSQVQTNTDKRLPITFDILQNICVLLEQGVYTPFTDSLLLAVCTLAFFGFLRCGEFTARSKREAEFENCLSMQDISFAKDLSYYTLTLRSSKTDPFRQGVLIHIFQNEKIHPVTHMWNYFSARKRLGKVQNYCPLFVNAHGDILTRAEFLDMIRHLLSRLNLDDSRYCGHSFRKGAATSSAGVMEDHLIQTLGRWSSNCYVRYISISKDELRNAQLKMCHS